MQLPTVGWHPYNFKRNWLAQATLCQFWSTIPMAMTTVNKDMGS